MKKKFVLLFIVLVLLARFLPKNLPETSIDNPSDFIANNEVPEDVVEILKTSCYDCHSNETVYPWYSEFMPVSFLISHDIEEGREELNFSDWESFDKRKKLKYVDEISESIESGEMPFAIYLVTHRDAALDEQQKERLIDWFENNYAESLFN